MADKAITAANVAFSARAQYKDGYSGVAITPGQPCYIDRQDGNKIKLTDANGSAQASVCDGLAAGGASGPGQRIAICWKDPDYTPGFTIAAGDIIITSNAEGMLAPAADVASTMRVTVVMIGKAGNKAVLDIAHSPDAKP